MKPEVMYEYWYQWFLEGEAYMLPEVHAPDGIAPPRRNYVERFTTRTSAIHAFLKLGDRRVDPEQWQLHIIHTKHAMPTGSLQQWADDAALIEATTNLWVAPQEDAVFYHNDGQLYGHDSTILAYNLACYRALPLRWNNGDPIANNKPLNGDTYLGPQVQPMTVRQVATWLETGSVPS